MKETFGKILQPQLLLIYILVFAFLVRMIGIGYGLPFWLIDDEPPFTLAALKMIQLKTLLPVFHLEDFRTVLYYPPYLSYLYLAPFSLLLGIKFFLFNEGTDQFVYYLTGDLSHFFLIARFINVLIGVASVYLLYQVGKNLFKQEAAALAAAFFLSSSLFHILFSSVGRHWLPVSFVFLLGWWFLSKENFSFKKRFALALIIAGLGIGISPIVSFLTVLIFYWLVFYERNNFLALLKDKYFYGIILLFIGLAILPGILYPQSFGFRADLTSGQTKSISGILQSPFLFLKPVALSEPILAIFAVLGLVVSALYQRRLFWPLFLFIYTYSGVFYWFFRYEHRFTLPLFPILALLAGIGFDNLYRRISSRILSGVFLLILAVPLILSLRLGYLIYKNDSRTLLREWAEQNIPSGSKILVYARLTRLPSSKEAIEEQRLLDPQSLRKVDAAEANLTNRTGKFFHALNLYDVNNPEFYGNLEKYARDNNYQYVFLGGTDPREIERLRIFQGLADQGSLLKSFGEFQEDYSLSIGQLTGNPLYLFKLKEFGPPVAIYKLY